MRFIGFFIFVTLLKFDLGRILFFKRFFTVFVFLDSLKRVLNINLGLNFIFFIKYFRTLNFNFFYFAWLKHFIWWFSFFVRIRRTRDIAWQHSLLHLFLNTLRQLRLFHYPWRHSLDLQLAWVRSKRMLRGKHIIMSLNRFIVVWNVIF